MTTKNPTPTKARKRHQQIADLIGIALRPIAGLDHEADETRANAKLAVADADNAKMGGRENMLIDVGAMSAKFAWTIPEVDAAAKLVASSNNDKSRAKTIETLIGEIKAASHPAVRDHVASLVALRDEAWTAETTAKAISKDAPMPIAKAFARKYHVLTGLFNLAKEGRVLSTVDQLVMHATACDPDLNAKRVAAKIAAMVKTLTTYKGVFGDEDLQAAIDTLTSVDENTLEASRIRAVAEVVVPVVHTHKVSPDTSQVSDEVSDEVSNEVITTTVGVTDATDDIATGACDILDEFLGDITGNNPQLELREAA